MTEINVEQRQKLKQEAAQMAITDANLSQWLAGAAAAVSLASPPHAAALALGAAMMGVCGNYRQAVANDPPRDDFDEVWVTTAALDDSLFPEENRLNTCHRFAATQMLLTDAIFALLRALERHDGAVAAGNSDAAVAQADAAQKNADKIAELQAELSSLGANMNEVIASLRGGGPGFASLTIDQVIETYKNAWGAPPESPGAALQDLARAITGTADDLLEPFDAAEAHPILSASAIPADRSTPFEASYLGQLASCSSSMQNLVA